MSLSTTVERALAALPPASGQPAVVEFSCELDLEHMIHGLARGAFEQVVLWDTRASETLEPELCIGLSAAFDVRVAGGDRFRDAKRRVGEILSALGDPRVRAFGAFAYDGGPLGEFEPFGHARFVVPRWTFTLAAHGARGLLVARVAEPGQRAALVAEAKLIEALTKPVSGRKRRRPVGSLVDDGAPAFRRAVELAIAAIGEGTKDGSQLEKVVVARAARVASAPPFGEVLARLGGAAACVRFGLACDGLAFGGATPELLAQFDGHTLRTEALAGTEPRRGSDLLEASRLLTRDKDLREHALVVSAIKAELVAAGLDVLAEPEPRLRTLTHVHHLVTPITATAAGSTHVIDHVARLHPTPAMGGSPRAEAERFRLMHEGIGRGFYASPFGWFDVRGNGAFVVGIRCALLLPEGAWLFAGAGIVRGSVVDAELSETSAKLRTMLNAIAGERFSAARPSSEEEVFS